MKKKSLFDDKHRVNVWSTDKKNESSLGSTYLLSLVIVNFSKEADDSIAKSIGRDSKASDASSRAPRWSDARAQREIKKVIRLRAHGISRACRGAPLLNIWKWATPVAPTGDRCRGGARIAGVYSPGRGLVRRRARSVALAGTAAHHGADQTSSSSSTAPSPAPVCSLVGPLRMHNQRKDN